MIKHRIAAAGVVITVLLVLTGCMTPSQAFERMEKSFVGQPTISVEGVGIAEAEPDAASLRVTVSELRETTREAQHAANSKTARILEAAERMGLDEDDISTESIGISPEYSWKDGERKLLGQRVRQTLSLEVRRIDEEPGRPGELIDILGTVEGIELSSLSFYVEDTEELYRQAREAAFNKARQKAVEFSRLGGTVLGSPISISEHSQDYGIREAQPKMAMLESSPDYQQTQIPAGSFSVRVQVSVQFAIEPAE